jgi:adenine-specific DNA-methyltransferase
VAGRGPGPAYEVGLAYEATLSPAARRDGAHYTPPDVAAGLATRALDLLDRRALPRCWDPACGGGAFLVAMAEELVARGWPAGEVVDHAVTGTDVDPGAVAASRAALGAWAASHGLRDVAPRVAGGDGGPAWIGYARGI